MTGCGEQPRFKRTCGGLLVALTVLVVMSRGVVSRRGDFFCWFSGLRIMLAVAVQPGWGLPADAAAVMLAGFTPGLCEREASPGTAHAHESWVERQGGEHLPEPRHHCDAHKEKRPGRLMQVQTQAQPAEAGYAKQERLRRNLNHGAPKADVEERGAPRHGKPAGHPQEAG